MVLELTKEEEKLILDRRKALEELAKMKKCPKCNGEGKVFSGYWGHPETSDGGPIMYCCTDCNGSGLLSEKQYRRLR